MADKKLRSRARLKELENGNSELDDRAIRDLIQAGEDPIKMIHSEQRTEVLDRLLKMGIVSYQELETALTPKTKFQLENNYRIFSEKVLQQGEILEKNENGEWGITAIDGNFYRMPSLEDIKKKMSAKTLQMIDQLDQPVLLLVPFGMDVQKLAEKISNATELEPFKRQAHPLFGGQSKVDINKYLSAAEIRYFAEDYSPEKGLTKEQVIDRESPWNSFPGWQVVIVDGSHEIDQSKIMVEDGLCWTAFGFLSQFHKNNMSGITHEEWICLHLYGMRIGVPFDANGYCWLTESKISNGTGSSEAVLAYLNTQRNKAEIGMPMPPHFGNENIGSRAAVRIL